MIPYLQFDQFYVGPLTIHVWGLLVALGMIAAVLMATKLARRHVFSENITLDGMIWMIAGALIFARLFHAVFYEPVFFLQNPVEIVKFWQGGMSSSGGFLGAVAALYLFAKKRGLKWKELSPYFDIWALSLWLGWGIGRLGCFLTHQHPGKLTNFFIGVNYPGGARFDLGLLESLLGFLLFIIFSLLFNKLIKKQRGLVALYSSLAYAVARFGLDFLRATPLDYLGGDVRYFSLTPAQWLMLALFAVLSGMVVKLKVKSDKLII